MPEARLQRTRESLPPDYQFGDGRTVDCFFDVEGVPYKVTIPERHLPHTQSVDDID